MAKKSGTRKAKKPAGKQEGRAQARGSKARADKKAAAPRQRKAKRPRKAAPASPPAKSRASRSAPPKANSARDVGQDRPARAKPDRARSAAPSDRPGQAGHRAAKRRWPRPPRPGAPSAGRTNPMPTKRSTGTAAGAGDTRRSPAPRARAQQLREVEETVQSPPSSLNLDRHGSAARSGRAAPRRTPRRDTPRPAR